MSRTGDPYPLVRSPWGRTTTAPDLSPAEAEIVAAFEAAPTPPEVREAAVVEEVARAMWDTLADDNGPWDAVSALLQAEYRRLAAAAVGAYRAAQDGGAEEAVRRVEALTERLEDESGYLDPFTARVGVAGRLRAALATQAGDGAR